MTTPRILIACVGNIFLGDDGFGTEVAQRLERRPLPSGVILKDFGIRALDLAYALLDPHELVILVDACARGGEPGTIYLLEPEQTEDNAPGALVNAHAMNPTGVLRLVKSMGGPAGKVLIVGCEPLDLGSEEGKLGLSDPVLAAVDQAVSMIDTLISKTFAKEPVLQSH